MRPFLRLENEQKSCAIRVIHSWKSPKLTKGLLIFVIRKSLKVSNLTYQLLIQFESAQNNFSISPPEWD
jgi:hypothetical protein